MGQTSVQYIPGVTIQSGITTYPRYIGEVLPHPYLQNTLLEVLEVWDGSEEIWGNLNEPIPFPYGSEANPITRDWNTPPPRRDESSKYPIYKCRVNGANEQWIVFKWILLDENRPTDLLGYSSTQVASGNALPTPPIAPNLPITTTFRTLPIEMAMSFSSATFTTEASTDSDALAVITAIEATGVSLTPTEETAITNRIVSAKSDGAWAKWVAYYGFVGGTATSHAINWKNPSLYAITWNGTITHDAFGVKGDGSTGYGNTSLNPASVLTTSAAGLGFYYTEVKASEVAYEIGSGLFGASFGIYRSTTLTGYEYGTNSIDITNTGDKQYLSGNTISTSQKLYRNGLPIGTATGSANFASLNLFILARNNSGSPAFYSTGRLGSAAITTGLTDAEETANYTSELAFQTALGRN